MDKLCVYTILYLRGTKQKNKKVKQKQIEQKGLSSLFRIIGFYGWDLGHFVQDLQIHAITHTPPPFFHKAFQITSLKKR